jgi:hypothetical protein
VNDAIQLGSPAGFEFAIDTPENSAAIQSLLTEAQKVVHHSCALILLAVISSC